MSEIDTLISKIEQAAKDNDPSALNAACADLIRYIHDDPDTIGDATARKALGILRKHRRFEQMMRVADAILGDGSNDAQVRRQYAQALIECGALTPAIGILNDVIADPATAPAELADAKGVLGRAWKERALAARGKREAAAVTALKNAFASYGDVYRKDPNAFYQGINMVALAMWDRGLALDPKDTADARAAAKDILQRIEAIPADKREAWDLATAAEALIALGRTQEAVAWLKAYVAHAKTDAFELGSTVRQLTEVWRLSDREGGPEILAPLRARLCELPGGSFVASSKDLRQMAAVDQEQYERVLGDAWPVTYGWIQLGIDRARSIALFTYAGRGFGTGFVVRGSDLDPRLGNELMILTNAHVVSDPPMADARRPREARVIIELLPLLDGKRQIFTLDDRIVWQSPPSEHDACLLRLTSRLPESVQPLSIGNDLPWLKDEKLPAPPRDKKERVLIIGHPLGGEISFSFEDNELLDYEHGIAKKQDDVSPCRIHYRTPTEKGSSGSPVFDQNWDAVALHRRGGQLQRLNGGDGTYAANEGVWIQSIRRAMAKAAL